MSEIEVKTRLNAEMKRVRNGRLSFDPRNLGSGKDGAELCRKR